MVKQKTIEFTIHHTIDSKTNEIYILLDDIILLLESNYNLHSIIEQLKKAKP